MDVEKDLRKLELVNARATAEYLRAKLQEAEQEKDFGYQAGRLLSGCGRVYRRKIQDIRTGMFIRRLSGAYQKGASGIPGGLNANGARKKRIIVTLTSYRERLLFVPAVAWSLLNQTVRPDRIILWLGEQERRSGRFPKAFAALREKGVEIKFRPDIGVHTKWYYAFKEFPHDLIVTVDDDVIYEDSVIEKLYRCHMDYPGYTPALRVHRMRYTDDGRTLPYRDWIWEYSAKRGTASHQFFLTGVGGVLHCPDELCKEVMDIADARKLCPNEDDAWLTLMNVKSNRRVILADDVSRIPGTSIGKAQKTALWKSNILLGKSMEQYENVLSEYNKCGRGQALLEKMLFDSPFQVSTKAAHHIGRDGKWQCRQKR